MGTRRSGRKSIINNSPLKALLCKKDFYYVRNRDIIGKTLAANLFDMYRLGDDNELPIRHLIKLCELYNVSADYILGLKRKQD
jgi:hypothetical protein